MVDELPDAVPLPVPGLDERARPVVSGDLQGRGRGLTVDDPDADPIPGPAEPVRRDPVDHGSDALFLIEGREEDLDTPSRFGARLRRSDRLGADGGGKGTPEDPIPPRAFARALCPSWPTHRYARPVRRVGSSRAAGG